MVDGVVKFYCFKLSGLGEYSPIDHSIGIDKTFSWPAIAWVHAGKLLDGEYMIAFLADGDGKILEREIFAADVCNHCLKVSVVPYYNVLNLLCSMMINRLS